MRKPVVNDQVVINGYFFLSKYLQVLSQNDHLSKNGNGSKVIDIGILFGITGKTKISKTTQTKLSNVYPNKCLQNSVSKNFKQSV